MLFHGSLASLVLMISLGKMHEVATMKDHVGFKMPIPLSWRCCNCFPRIAQGLHTGMYSCITAGNIKMFRSIQLVPYESDSISDTGVGCDGLPKAGQWRQGRATMAPSWCRALGPEASTISKAKPSPVFCRRHTAVVIYMSVR
jgi:hypothetical protein